MWGNNPRSNPEYTEPSLKDLFNQNNRGLYQNKAKLLEA